MSTASASHGQGKRVIRSLGDIGDPVGVLLRWPVDDPVFALVSPGDDPRERWSILSSAACISDVVDLGRAPSVDETLARVAASTSVAGAVDELPFIGGWVGWLGYGLGASIEPAARDRASTKAPSGSLGWFARCDAALVRDERTREWLGVGVSDDALDRLLTSLGRSEQHDHRCAVGSFRSSQGREAYEAAVARTVEYIRAGDIFQANIAHELRASFSGSTRAAFAAMARAARPAFGAYLETPAGVRDARVICSISPELFLDADLRARRVTTRPIKGTRAGADPALAEELRASDKDAAELAMIVDLMRNDLSRVCEPGSVRVDEPRALERHGGGSVLHAVATVSGRLRERADFPAIVRATFPPGSVTGAPKVRAMQIIDELEPFDRGVYCGGIGFVSDSGAARLSVAIRTATIDTACGEIVYPVGAGIVAQSDPASEWEETLVKARAIAAAFSTPG